MSSGAQVAKNAAWLIGATTVNKVLAFVVFFVVARWAGPLVTGTFFFSISVTSVFVVLADLGMTPVIIRAVAADREDAARLLGAALKAKLMFIPLAIVGAIGYALMRHVDVVTLTTIAVACAVMSADTVHLILYGALRGKQNLRPESIGMFIGQILTAVVTLIVAAIGGGPIWLAVGLLFGSSWNVIWSIWNMRRFGIAWSAARWIDLRQLFQEAVPFAIAGISVKLYSYVDSLLIQAHQGTYTVGMYAVAYKMTYALQFLPLTFSAALYPAFAASWKKHDHEGIQRTFLGSLRFLAAISFLLSSSLSALAAKIIPFIYGPHYIDAIAPFQILPWVLLPIFMDFPVGALMNATHRAHLKTTAMVCTMAVNVILNFILVPRFGPVGAAWSGVVSFWTLLFIGLWFTRNDAGWKSPLWILVRASIVSALSWIVWTICLQFMPWIVAAIVGGVVAVGFGFASQLMTVNDLRFLKRLRRSQPDKTDEETIHADS